MPTKHRAVESASFAKREYAFEIGGLSDRAESDLNRLVGVRVFLVRHDPIEEASRRELLLVSDNDHLLCACYETERILRPHLACLVNHQKIEFHGIGRKELRHRDWTHQQHGFDALKRLPRRLEQFSDRHVSASARYLRADRIHCAEISARHSIGMASAHDLNSRSSTRRFEPPELVHDRVMRRAVEAGQFR